MLRRAGRLAAATTCLIAAVVSVAPAPGRPALAGTGPATYIVQLRMAAGAAVGALDAQTRRALARAGAAEALVLYRYRVALAGFAVRLTSAEAARLGESPEVLLVTPERTFRPDAAGPGPPASAPAGIESDSAGFLGLPQGLWARLGGPDHAGEGVVVGVIDTGVYPEHPSFADQPASAPAPARWRGTCQAGEGFPAATCSHKLVGARYFVEGFGAVNLSEGEFLSPRDANGHGSHVAAIAVGDYGVAPAIAGNDLGVGRISGVAPRAQLAAYKVCWDGRGSDGAPAEEVCRESDIVAAVEAAMTDGVDVLNLSLGAGPSAVFGPFEGALLQAAGAGIFIAGSAGNNGPETGSVGAPGDVPWATSVAATTLTRAFQASAAATGGGGRLEVHGASATPGLDRVRLVDAATAAAPGVEAARAQRCQAGSLDPATVRGAAVLCRRGGNGRLDKGRAVHDGGGAGMILANDSDAETLAADVQPLPALNVSRADGLALQRLLSAGPAEISMTAGRAVASVGDVLAEFSSRGPQTAVPDIPKPDLAAPGVAILAASTPTPSRPDQPREAFRVLNGTSMSSAVVAGAAALLHQLDPGRSPAALKSSLMTTARPEVHGAGGEPSGPFEAGSGRLDPTRAADPGLVLDVAAADYARYLQGVDPKSVTGQGQPIAPSDLNLPAVSYSALTGAAVTRRTFTGTDRAAGTWRVQVEGLAGVVAVALPDRFTVEPGHTQDVRLAFAWAGARWGRYVFGAVVLTNAADGRRLRLPVSIRPAPVNPPSG